MIGNDTMYPWVRWNRNIEENYMSIPSNGVSVTRKMCVSGYQKELSNLDGWFIHDDSVARQMVALTLHIRVTGFGICTAFC